MKKNKKIKGYKGGGMDASTKSFDKSLNPGRKGGPIGRDDPTTPVFRPSGNNNTKTSTGNVSTGNQNTNTGQKTTFMPITMQVAKALVIDPLTKYSRTQKVKGESFFGKPKDLPATKDYYRAYGEPIDVMSKKGTDFMKDAGLIKPIKTVKPPEDRGGNRQQLCPDGSYPPCKTPTTQIKTPVTKPNTFLSGFQAYDDGGEVVISSNVDKSLL